MIANRALTGAAYVLAISTEAVAYGPRLGGCPHAGVHVHDRQQTKVFCLGGCLKLLRVSVHAGPAGVEALR